MSARTIALQLRTLAADPESRGLLLQEASCLSGLVTLLHADNEEDVLIMSLHALGYLAAEPANHEKLVHAPGLLVALTTLTEKSAVVLRNLAQNVMGALETYINGGVTVSTSGAATPTLGGINRGRTPTMLGSGRNGSRDNSRPATRAGKEDPLGNVKSAQVDSADKENQDSQTSAPVSKPGYLKKSAPAVSASAANASTASTSSSSSGAPSRPGYLTASSASHSATGGSRALAVHATASSASDSASSLAARYQAQQAAKKKAEAAAAAAPQPAKKGGLISGITSYFW